jgi:hypothetical protein
MGRAIKLLFRSGRSLPPAFERVAASRSEARSGDNVSEKGCSTRPIGYVWTRRGLDKRLARKVLPIVLSAGNPAEPCTKRSESTKMC